MIGYKKRSGKDYETSCDRNDHSILIYFFISISINLIQFLILFLSL